MSAHRRLYRLLLFASLLFAAAFSSCSSGEEDDPDPQVTEDENLYINEIYSSGDDWVEVYNKSTVVKDVSGYRIYDDVTNKYTLPAGTSIPPGGFLVIFCDDLNTGLHTNFKLTSAGETVYLENAKSAVIDKVIFPELNNGQSYGRFPDGSTSFLVSGFTTQGATNGESNAPAIVAVTRNPVVVSMNDKVTVKSEFVSLSNVSSANLHYRVNGAGSFISLPMTLTNGAYAAEIPALNGEGRVDYYVEAKNSFGSTTVKPFSAPEKTYNYLITDDVLPQLIINEFMAFNSACCPDNSTGTDEFDDWIEVHNPTAQPINIGGMYLSDDKSNPFNHRIADTNPTLTTIPAGGYIIIWADNDSDQGELHLDFSLSNEGEDIGLYYYDGRAIDEVSFGLQSENVSMTRNVDDGGYSGDATPTPGAANQ